VLGSAGDALALQPTVVGFKATIPAADTGADVTVELTKVPDSMSEAKAKYLPETGFFLEKKEKTSKKTLKKRALYPIYREHARDATGTRALDLICLHST